jgi:hypothetical protein
VITFIVPSVGRSSLEVTLASIETWPGDEILVVGELASLDRCISSLGVLMRPLRFLHCSRGNDWGHAERNFATPHARGSYIAHIDDDDVYAPGTRALMQDVIEQTPNRPAIFRMRFPNGITLWQEPTIRCGNLGTPCFLIPNVPGKMGHWGSFVGGDCWFLETSKWAAEDYVWRPEIIAHLGHNIGG